MICTVGKIKNNSDVAWKEVQLEVQYFDKDGTLIDSGKEHNYATTILPHDELAFRIRTTADKREPAYASHKVIVRSARDDRGWP